MTSARKPHICARCGDLIAKGAQYRSWRWLGPGEPPRRFGAHVLCDRLDIGHDDVDDVLDMEFGIEEWWDLIETHAPQSWVDVEVWPPAFHDELIALLGGAS